MYSYLLAVGLCTVLGAKLADTAFNDDIVTSIMASSIVTTATSPTTTRATRVPRTGNYTTSRRQKRRPSPIKRNRHLKKFSKKALMTTEHRFLMAARQVNYSIPTGRIEIIGFIEIKQHVELFKSGGFRIYIEDDYVTGMVFLGNLNRPYEDNPTQLVLIFVNYKHIDQYDPKCDMYGKVKQKVDGKLIYENRNVTLLKGDVINYRLVISCADGSYRVKTHQYFTVRKIRGTLVPEIPYEAKVDKHYADSKLFESIPEY